MLPEPNNEHLIDSTESELEARQRETETASRRMILYAVAIGVISIFGAAAILYAASVLAREREIAALLGDRADLAVALAVAAVSGVLAPFALFLLYRGNQLARQTALAAIRLLRESQSRYRGLYHYTPVMMHSINEKGFLIRVNDYWLEKLGYLREEVLGRPSIDFLTEESQRKAKEENLPRFFKEGISLNNSYQMVTKSGDVIDVLLSSTSAKNERGDFLISHATIVDVTPLKRMEAERETVIRQLKRKNDELERFTYTVSHDLKSPLVTIKGFLGFVRNDLEGGDPERLRADVDRIAEAADHMSRLLDELLELSRVGRVINAPQEVALAELVQEALEMVAGPLAEHGVEVDVQLDLPRVSCDPLRIRQVFQNLLDNAVKFMGEQEAPRIEIGGHIESGEHDEIVCHVRDNGVGLAPRYQEKVFELFEKMDSDSAGTGIGLALVRQVVELHGGRVWVESAGEGQGSAFFFTLPLEDLPESSGIINLKTLRNGVVNPP